MNMDYINAIANYYGCFSSYGTTYVGGKQKFRLKFSGKINRKNIIMFFILGLILFLLGLLNKNKISSIICFIIYIITVVVITIKSKIFNFFVFVILLTINAVMKTNNIKRYLVG